MPNTPLNKEELRDKLKNIARFKFGPFKDTVPAKIILMPSDSDPRKGNGGMQYSYDAFIDDVIELYIADRDASVREALYDELSTCETRGNYSGYVDVYVRNMTVRERQIQLKDFQSQPNAKELHGVEVKIDDKLPKNGIRFDHPDGRSEGFVLDNAKEGE